MPYGKSNYKKKAPARRGKSGAKKTASKLEQKRKGVRTGRSMKRNGSQDGTRY